MKKTKKDKIFFTIDSEINKVFEKYINDNIIDRSKLIEILITEHLKSKKLIN